MAGRGHCQDNIHAVSIIFTIQIIIVCCYLYVGSSASALLVNEKVVCIILKKKIIFCQKKKYLLCFSYPSATEFSAILFLLFARSSSNSPRSFQRFRRTLVPSFIQIRQRDNNFPIDVITLPKAGIFYNGGYGVILHLLSNPVEILPQSSSKVF